MKGTGLAVKAYAVAGLLSLAGIGMMLSVVLAGPGVILLTVAFLLLLGGLVRDLVRVSGTSEAKPAQQAPLEPAKAKQ